MKIEFDEEVLRHYCRLHLPELNGVLSLDTLDCAIAKINSKPCELCERFKETIKLAILNEASHRLETVEPHRSVVSDIEIVGDRSLPDNTMILNSNPPLKVYNLGDVEEEIEKSS